uniref:Putative methyltransferase n=1 Tax=candidate division WWE3 bacterium TaxID=2053526 RepID=A0A7C4TJN5_UNCKA
MFNLLYEASKKTGLPTKKVLDFVYHLQQLGSIDTKSLIKLLGISKSSLVSLAQNLNTLIKTEGDLYTISPGTNINLSNHLVEEGLWPFLSDGKFLENAQKIEAINIGRRKADRNFDQFYATAETVAKRVSLMNFFADIAGKRILFLGDDDQTSVLTASYGNVKEIIAVDIDDGILSTIKQNAPNVLTLQHDFKQPLPKELTNGFDVVFTDPPYTQNGIRLFLSRAIEALDINNAAARIYMCYGNSDRAKERYLPIYNIILETNLMIRWVLDKFNRYNGAESIGSTSSLFILDITPKIKPIVKGSFDSNIYTNETNS